MKRYGGFYDAICSMDNLREAHRNARKGKSHYKEVQMVDNDPDYYLKQIQQILLNQTYKVAQYETFKKVDKGKERLIYKLPYYPDRIIQWAILIQVEHVFLKTFIHDTFASLPNRGIHQCLKRLHKSMENREETLYCLKFDIKKYFPSIKQEILKAMLRRKFKDKRLLWLLDGIVDSSDEGIPIGNYMSQYLANYYLSWLDHWLKEDKKCRHYFRYMDDVVILGSDKNDLHRLKREIEEFLWDTLELELKGDWQIFPTYIRGVDFVGYRSFGDYTLLRKSTATNIKNKVKSIEQKGFVSEKDICSIESYKGWLKWADCFNLLIRWIRRFNYEGARNNTTRTCRN